MYLVVPPGGCFPETRRIELGPAALTIGRAQGCEIQVDVPGVDQEHARISEVALIALGPDCAIGDVPLEQGSRRLLMPGDEIQIGSVVVALEGDDPSIDSYSPENPHRAGEPRLESPRVRVVEGSNFGDELLLRKENHPYTIGRGASCDLVIEDREVSREHVKLLRRGFNVFVMDASSTRGSWLGRAAVYQGATVEWSRPRMMRVGATVLSLEMPEAVRRAAPAAQASAPMTPPPRSRVGSNAGYPGRVPPAGQSSPALSSRSGPDSAQTPASAPGSWESGSVPSDRGPQTVPLVDKTTQKLPPYTLEGGQTPPMAPLGAYGGQVASPAGPTGTAVMPVGPVGAAETSRSGPPPGIVYTPQPTGAQAYAPHLASVPLAASSSPMMMAAPSAGGDAAASAQKRRAWKKTGPTIGRFSGLLLLALAGLAILGALFVVFSLLE